MSAVKRKANVDEQPCEKSDHADLKKKKKNIQERWVICTNCIYHKRNEPQKAKYFISGYYFGESLCEECMRKREVHCGECSQGTGIFRHNGKDPNSGLMPSVICMSCIQNHRKRFEEDSSEEKTENSNSYDGDWYECNHLLA
jgi:hypothetical protein